MSKPAIPSPSPSGAGPHPEPAASAVLTRRSWPALLLLGAGLLATALATHHTRKDLATNARQEFDFACHEIGLKVQQRMQDHEQILRSGAGLFAASPTVSRAQWRTFVQSLRVEQQFPGIQGVGFALRIPPERLAAHVEEVRQEGFPEYRVWPEGGREVYSAIVYLEPFTNRNLRAFGYDMLSENVRRAALERARDENTAALTGKVKLVQETATDVQVGTLMFLPVYQKDMPITTVAERRAALQGWVYSPYRMNDLMQGILGGWESSTPRHIRLQVFDGAAADETSLLYDTQRTAEPSRSPGTGFETETPITYADRRWTLRFTQDDTGTNRHAYLGVWGVAGAGASVSLLLAGLLHSLRNTRYNAQRLARRLTADLQRTTERLALATEAGGVGIWDYEIAGDTLIWDDPMFRLYGITRTQFGGAYEAWTAGVHPDDRQRGDEEIQRALRGEQEFNTEFRVRWPDGTVRHIRALARVQRDAAGQPVRMIGTNWDITERKQAEQALRESKLWLEETQRIARLSGWKANPHTDYLEWTDEVFEIIEFPKGTQPGLAEGLKFYLPEYIPILWNSIARCLETGERFAVECQGITGTGKVIWTEVRGLAPVSHGDRAYVMGTFQDITERKRVEMALRESEANFRTFFESMTDMIMVGTPQGRILFTNAAVTRTLGYTPEELLTMEVLDVHPADKRTEAVEIFAAMFRGERTSCPLPLVHKDGSLVPVETRVWFGRWNGTDCLFGISKNLTAEVEAQQRFERLFRNNPALMALSTLPDRRFFDANEAFLKALGHVRSDVIGRTAKDLGLFPDVEQQARMAERLLAEGHIADFELQVQRRDGAILHGLFSGEIIINQGQQYLLTVMVDITERKRAEAELLRALSAERELSALKSNFVSMVSHEFRTPLGAILGASEMLEDFSDRLTPEKRASYFTMIRQEIQRLTGMLQDVLLQGQLDAGRVQAKPRPTDMVELCRGVAARVQAAFPKHPKIQFEADAPGGRSLLDESLLERVLSNLLTNAFKYSPNRTPVRFSVRRVEEEWLIQVQDQGIGIPEADQATLFSAFRRGGNVGVIKGTGVGLYIVKKCTELQGGRVELHSQVGQGSTFTLHLPWRPFEPPAPPPIQ